MDVGHQHRHTVLGDIAAITLALAIAGALAWIVTRAMRVIEAAIGMAP